MKTSILIAALLCAASLQAGDVCARPKPVYKITKLSLSEVGIACLNGGDPTGRKIGDILIISCGK